MQKLPRSTTSDTTFLLMVGLSIQHEASSKILSNFTSYSIELPPVRLTTSLRTWTPSFVCIFGVLQRATTSTSSQPKTMCSFQNPRRSWRSRRSSSGSTMVSQRLAHPLEAGRQQIARLQRHPLIISILCLHEKPWLPPKRQPIPCNCLLNYRDAQESPMQSP
jgi:hypothetical protein